MTTEEFNPDSDIDEIDSILAADDTKEVSKDPLPPSPPKKETQEPVVDEWLTEDGHSWNDFVSHFKSPSTAKPYWDEYKRNHHVGKNKGGPKKKKKATPKSGHAVEVAPQTKAPLGQMQVGVSGKADTELQILYGEALKEGFKGTYADWMNEKTKERVQDEGWDVAVTKHYGGPSSTTVDRREQDAYRKMQEDMARMQRDGMTQEMMNLRLEQMRSEIERNRIEQERRRKELDGGRHGSDNLIEVVEPVYDNDGKITGLQPPRKVTKAEWEFIQRRLESERMRALTKNDSSGLLVAMQIMEMNKPKDDDISKIIVREFVNERRDPYRGRPNAHQDEERHYKEKRDMEERLERERIKREEAQERRWMEQQANQTKMFEMMMMNQQKMMEFQIQQFQSKIEELRQPGLYDQLGQTLIDRAIAGGSLFGPNSADAIEAQRKSHLTETVTSNLDRVMNMAEAGVNQSLQNRQLEHKAMLSAEMPGHQLEEVSESKMEEFLTRVDKKRNRKMNPSEEETETGDYSDDYERIV